MGSRMHAFLYGLKPGYSYQLDHGLKAVAIKRFGFSRCRSLLLQPPGYLTIFSVRFPIGILLGILMVAGANSSTPLTTPLLQRPMADYIAVFWLRSLHPSAGGRFPNENGHNHPIYCQFSLNLEEP